jgi:predicted dehydrogenase
MRHGKDVMLDKPGATSLEQLAELRQAQSETGRILSICYSEHYRQRATVEAGRLVQAGAIGRVIQTIGLGPHRLGLNPRPAWFFERAKYGGILCDIGSHQVEQFLFFTGSTEAEVVTSQVGNFAHPDTPELEDFGDMLLRSPAATGYVRVDWFTPDGLGTWGDGRLTILGTEGTIELRKYVDIAGGPAATTSSSSTARAPATSTAATRPCPTAPSSATTCSTAPRRRCPRRTASSRPSWRSRRRRTRRGSRGGGRDDHLPAAAAPARGGGGGRDRLATYRGLLEAAGPLRGSGLGRPRPRPGAGGGRAVRRAGHVRRVRGSPRARRHRPGRYLHPLEPALRAVAGRLRAGKHVVCEKPIAGSLAEIDALIAAERESGRRASPIFQYRFGNGFQKLLHLKRKGALGKTYLATVETHWSAPPPTTPCPGAAAGRPSSAAAS